ncbi:unnamed protein product [Colias eurytheme]|nr:unnamed protein product [Colias eurytheme]
MGGTDEDSVIRNGSDYAQSLGSPAPLSPTTPPPSPLSIVSGDDDVSTSSSTRIIEQFIKVFLCKMVLITVFNLAILKITNKKEKRAINIK